MKRVSCGRYLFLVLFLIPILVLTQIYTESGFAAKNEFPGQKRLERTLKSQRVSSEWAAAEGVIISYDSLEYFDLSDNKKIIAELGFVEDIIRKGKVWFFHDRDRSVELIKLDHWYQLLKDRNPEFIENIEFIKYSSRRHGYQSIWSRDWGPMTMKHASTTPNNNSKISQRSLLNFNYYLGSSQSEDDNPKVMGRKLRIKVANIPVYIEGGNFAINDHGYCVMSDSVYGANDFYSRKQEEPLSFEEVAAKITQYFKNFAGCQTVDIVPSMPFETTSHIDLWFKFLNNKTVLVNEVWPETIEASRKIGADNKMFIIKKYLDDRASHFKKRGFKVERIPMPVAMNMKVTGAPTFVTRSYTNSLYFNKSVYVPRYVVPSDANPIENRTVVVGANNKKKIRVSYKISSYPDAGLQHLYENKVYRVFSRYGFKPTFVRTDSTIVYGGSVHCFTMQVTR